MRFSCVGLANPSLNNFLNWVSLVGPTIIKRKPIDIILLGVYTMFL